MAWWHRGQRWNRNRKERSRFLDHSAEVGWRWRTGSWWWEIVGRRKRHSLGDSRLAPVCLGVGCWSGLISGRDEGLRGPWRSTKETSSSCLEDSDHAWFRTLLDYFHPLWWSSIELSLEWTRIMSSRNGRELWAFLICSLFIVSMTLGKWANLPVVTEQVRNSFDI